MRSPGAPALSAVRVDTFRPKFSRGNLVVGGRVGGNYQSGDNTDGFAGLWGSNDRTRFAIYHNTRTGNDYEDGDDNVIPGDYESFDTRWAVGFKPNAETTIEYLASAEIAAELTGFYQRDYPGLATSQRDDLVEAIDAISAAYDRTRFPGMEVGWGTYPNHLGHTDSPGCFRCHDELHVADDGSTIRQDCELCHTFE